MVGSSKLCAAILIFVTIIGTISFSFAFLTDTVLIRSTGNILAVNLWDNCDQVGKWKTTNDAIIEADTADKIEGTASLKMSYSSGWSLLFYKDGSWDFSATPILRFRFKAHNPLPANFRVGILTGPGWNSYKYNIHDQVKVGEWVIVEIDLRLPESNIPDLTNVFRVEFSCWDMYIPSSGSFSVDFIELLPGPPLPLEVSISPALSQFILINGTTINFKIIARGGQIPYTYEWFVNGVKQLQTQQAFTYVASQIGTYALQARVTDSTGSSINTSIITINVINKIKLPKPTMLHTQGAHVYNDNGEIVHLRGVHSTNFGDSSAGWFIGSSTSSWNETVIEKNLEVLESWGCNFLYLSGIDFGYLVENRKYGGATIGLMDAVKRVVEMAYEHGIYVAIGLDNGAYGELVWYYAPSHLDDWVNGWLNISRELRIYPNVIYGMNAEPALSEEEMNAYFNAIVQAVKAIRNDGDEHIFFYHEDYCSYPVRFNKPATEGGEMIRKLHECNLTNIVYSGHIYRWHGTFGGDPNNFTGAGPGENADGVYTYENIKQALTYWGYRKILEEYKVPIIMGEGGPAKAEAISFPNTWEKEITAYQNLLQILNEWNIGYACFWWREPGTEGPVFSPLIIPNQSDFIANEWGQILINALRTS